MIIGFTPLSTELFRAATAASKPPYVHNRRRCDCGKQITVKQLQQYGVCVSCVRSKAAS